MYLGRGFFVLLGDSGEFEDGAEVAPVSLEGACDCGFGLLDSFVFLRVLAGCAAGFLSLLRCWIVLRFCPTACAVGCILAPLRGWFYGSLCSFVFLGCVFLCGLWRGFCSGLCFDLDYRICRGLAGGSARATWAGACSGFDWGTEFGMFDQVLAGVVGDFAHHRRLVGLV